MADGAGNWCLIESDPGVFTELMKGFGINGLECEEVFDLDFLDRVPDAYGFIFLFKWEKTTEFKGDIVKDDRLDNIFFARQVITNACATQAILNVLLNIDNDKFQLGDTLSSLKSFCSSFDSNMKGLTLSNSDQIREVHNSFSSQNLFEFDEKSPSKDDDVYHFIGYIPIKGRLYELDGLQEGPIDHGAIPNGTSWLDHAKPVIQARMSSCANNNTHFNLMAIVPERLALYQEQLAALSSAVENQGMETNDHDLTSKDLLEKIEMEKNKFNRYKIENIRRRHNYLPFIVELLKILAEEGKLSPLLEEAKKKAEEVRKQKLEEKTGR